MVLRCFRKESVLAGFSAEARTPMVVVDETELSPTVCAPVLQLGRETLHRFGGYGTTRYTQATGGRAEARARISASPREYFCASDERAHRSCADANSSWRGVPPVEC